MVLAQWSCLLRFNHDQATFSVANIKMTTTSHIVTSQNWVLDIFCICLLLNGGAMPLWLMPSYKNALIICKAFFA